MERGERRSHWKLRWLKIQLGVGLPARSPFGRQYLSCAGLLLLAGGFFLPAVVLGTESVVIRGGALKPAIEGAALGPLLVRMSDFELSSMERSILTQQQLLGRSYVLRGEVVEQLAQLRYGGQRQQAETVLLVQLDSGDLLYLLPAHNGLLPPFRGHEQGAWWVEVVGVKNSTTLVTRYLLPPQPEPSEPSGLSELSESPAQPLSEPGEIP